MIPQNILAIFVLKLDKIDFNNRVNVKTLLKIIEMRA